MMLRSAATKLSRQVGYSKFAKNHALIRTATISTVAPKATTASFSRSSALVAVAAASLLLTISNNDNKTRMHCQVPCGIFDDPGMVSEVKQAATTVRKAMVQSNTLYQNENKGSLAMIDLNQVVRWIATKEEHCNKIIHLMGDYCLCQRVKRASFASEADYFQALEIHHKVMQAAMRAKQTMDVKACDELDHALEHLSKMYS
ncbi:ubiquitin [Seminavis robusta]|uniref:Ubiquitin n=1 Tax=Seminavis robusta TaxID=568900 RepID=A0A9N8EEB0_9STRA|nr:ubiquitin [Seminavis robusta]|eukprot:Sro874_g214200.1 ubiquitin (202) ;mRNA; f:18947-19552